MKKLGGEYIAIWLPGCVIGLIVGLLGAQVLFGNQLNIWLIDFWPATALSIVNPLQDLHQFFEQQLALFMSGPERALLSGLLFGGAQSFNREWREVFRVTGTSHLVAVSGMNVSLVMAGIEWLLTRWQIRPRSRFYYGVGLIGLYATLTGASASVLRAALMAVIGLLAPLVGRLVQPLNSLMAAIALMLLVQPHFLFDIGFQLSALATLGLVIFSPEPVATNPVRFWSTIAGVAQTTLAATIFTLGASTYYFGMFSALALLANLVVVPLIATLTLYGFVGLAVSLISVTVASWLTWPLYFLLHWVLSFLSWLAHWPGAAIIFQPTLSAVILYYFILFVGSGYWYWQRRFR